MQRQGKQFPVALALVVTDNYVCFEQDRRLVAVDPLTGQTLWTRDGLTADSDLWGDEELVFVAPPGGTSAQVLSGQDGREVGRCEAPRLDRRVLTLGRHILCWEPEGKQSTLRMADPWAKQDLWRFNYASDAQSWLIDDDEIAVFDPKGDFSVVSLETGRPVIQSKLDAVAGLEGIVVLKRSDGYLLVTNCPKPEPNIFGQSSSPGNLPVCGKAFSIDGKTGQKRWVADVPEQCLNIHQPADLPVLTFFRRYQKPIPLPNGMGFNAEPPVTQVFCLDSRTGAALHQDSVSQGYDDRYELAVQRADKKIEIRATQLTITFKFSDPPAKK
jgi:hypothetical protein